MSNYKRLTNNNSDGYDAEYDFCCGCQYFGEPCGCNRPNGTCDSYDRFLETYNRLSELEDKITDGTLRDIKVNIGDTIFLVDFIDVSSYYEGLKFIEILEPWEVNEIDIYKDDIIYRLTHNGTEDYNTAHGKEYGKNWFITKAEAEAKLKELQEK